MPVVVIPGWQGSGPGHWQSWLEEQLSEAGRRAVRPDLPDLDRPELAGWLAALRSVLAGLPADGYDVVAHSLGALLWLHHVADPGDSPRAARVVLVAPPSPSADLVAVAERAGFPSPDASRAFFPPPMDVDTVRHGADGTVLVAGDDDPYTPEGIATAYGLPLKIATTIVPGAGHLNEEAGYGPWPAMLDWCRRDNLAFY